MTITSLPFLGFAILSVLLFLVFPRKYRWISLLISSVAFYLIAAKWVIAYALISSCSIWYAARRMDYHRVQGEAQLKAEGLDKAAKKQIRARTASARKRVLVLALVLNIGILVFFKIFNYFTAAFTALVSIFTGRGGADLITLVMPLGISYYTFSTVGYLLDVYWKRYESEKNPVRFFLYTIYFPHILQGPISRYSLLGQELKKPALYFKWDNFVVGMEMILMGCFKKLVIADRAAIFVSNTIQTAHLKGMIYLLAIIFDAIQIYADFSGYTDIVRGLSKMFDVELEQNFNHPFLARSVPEFWRRWHMSLGSWFKDYVYYPITLSKGVKNLTRKSAGFKSARLRNLVSVVVPIMVTWLLTGLWHGTGYGYVAWGIYYGLLILLSVTFSEDIQNLLKKLGVRTECFSYRVFQTFKMFCIFMGGRFLGTTMTLGHRRHIIKQILKNFMDFSIFKYGLDKANFVILFGGVFLLAVVAGMEVKESIYDWFNRQNRIFCAIVIWIMFFAVFLLGIYGSAYDTSGFMYQQF